MGPNGRSDDASPPKSVTRGSFWRLVTSWTAIGSTITGATPATRPEPRSALAMRAVYSCGK